MNISKMYPEDVAKYAQQDSRALSKVAEEDLLYELKTRLCDEDFSAQQLANSLKMLTVKYDLWVMNSEEKLAGPVELFPGDGSFASYLKALRKAKLDDKKE